jgi:hypothetical protein
MAHARVRRRDRHVGHTPVSEERPAFYALRGGGWRDYWTLLHPPYTIWHLSYVAIGASLAPELRIGNLGWSLLAFFAAVGLSAHALDELNGRPLHTRIPSLVLVAIAALGLAGALAIGVLGVVRLSAWMFAFMAAGAGIALAYNLELLGGAFHSDLWFALGWGAFPALTGYFAQTGSVSAAAVAVSVACACLSGAQRVLSTPVRRLRRKALRIEGRVTYEDGAEEPVDATYLRSTPERALQLLSIAVPLLAVAMTVAALMRSG